MKVPRPSHAQSFTRSLAYLVKFAFEALILLLCAPCLSERILLPGVSHLGSLEDSRTGKSDDLRKPILGTGPIVREPKSRCGTLRRVFLRDHGAVLIGMPNWKWHLQ